jgi:hypothetical protein
MRLSEQHEVTLLCDEFEGIVVLPRYRDFQRTFECEDAEQEIPDWEDLVWSYIKDPDIPIVAFEYIAEKQPAKLEHLLRVLLDDETFSLEHLYAMLLHYKEPVEGLDDLKDDEKLWDLLDRKQPARHARGTPGRETNRPRRPAKATASEATGTAKKPALKKRRSQPKHKTKKKSAAASTKKPGASKKATKSRKGAASTKSAVKRGRSTARSRAKSRKAAKKRRAGG